MEFHQIAKVKAAPSGQSGHVPKRRVGGLKFTINYEYYCDNEYHYLGVKVRSIKSSSGTT